MKKPTKSELLVRVKHPNARCVTGGRPSFQIWDTLLSFAGNKLGQGNSENYAWKDAAKKETT